MKTLHIDFANLANPIDQRWATLFGLRSTLETKMVYAAQYFLKRIILRDIFDV
jgi:hypothetical protein